MYETYCIIDVYAYTMFSTLIALHILSIFTLCTFIYGIFIYVFEINICWNIQDRRQTVCLQLILLNVKKIKKIIFHISISQWEGKRVFSLLRMAQMGVNFYENNLAYQRICWFWNDAPPLTSNRTNPSAPIAKFCHYIYSSHDRRSNFCFILHIFPLDQIFLTVSCDIKSNNIKSAYCGYSVFCFYFFISFRRVSVVFLYFK